MEELEDRCCFVPRGMVKPELRFPDIEPVRLCDSGGAIMVEVDMALDMDERWPMVRAASEAMIWVASGRSYGLKVAGGRKVAGGLTRSDRYARLAACQ